MSELYFLPIIIIPMETVVQLFQINADCAARNVSLVYCAVPRTSAHTFVLVCCVGRIL